MKLLVPALLVAASTVASAAVDLAAGAQTAQACIACHGAGGVSQMAGTPSLAGQPVGYLEWQLVFLRSGQRKSEVMQPMAAPLKDQDIRNLAAYFAAQPPPKVSPDAKPEATLVAQGRQVAQANRCTSCHKDDFSGQQATARIAAQREDYLLKALRDFKSGKRIGGGVAAMADAVHPLGDEDFKALAHYLAHLGS